MSRYTPAELQFIKDNLFEHMSPAQVRHLLLHPRPAAGTPTTESARDADARNTYTPEQIAAYLRGH